MKFYRDKAMLAAVLYMQFAICGDLLAKKESLVADGSKPVKLAGGFKFTEGPAADSKGDV